MSEKQKEIKEINDQIEELEEDFSERDINQIEGDIRYGVNTRAGNPNSQLYQKLDHIQKTLLTPNELLNEAHLLAEGKEINQLIKVSQELTKCIEDAKENAFAVCKLEYLTALAGQRTDSRNLSNHSPS